MGDVEVRTAQLRSAAGGWRDQHDELQRARTKLAGVEGSTSAAGPRVQPALDAFLSTWIDELKKYADTAEHNSDNLDAAAADYDATDEATRAAMANLLPWDQR